MVGRLALSGWVRTCAGMVAFLATVATSIAVASLVSLATTDKAGRSRYKVENESEGRAPHNNREITYTGRHPWGTRRSDGRPRGI